MCIDPPRPPLLECQPSRTVGVQCQRSGSGPGPRGDTHGVAAGAVQGAPNRPYGTPAAPAGELLNRKYPHARHQAMSGRTESQGAVPGTPHLRTVPDAAPPHGRLRRSSDCRTRQTAATLQPQRIFRNKPSMRSLAGLRTRLYPSLHPSCGPYAVAGCRIKGRIQAGI